MKYKDFKIFKFSTILKNIDLIKDSFSRIFKKIKNIPSNIADSLSYTLKDIFSAINKSIKLIIHNLLKIFKFIDLRKINFKRVYRFFDIRRYDFYRINRKINPTNYKNVPLYFVAFVIFAGFVYVAIPKFYIYDKSKIEKIVCNNQNVECSIKGKIYYSFYPTPRIKIKDLLVAESFGKKNTLATVKDTAIKLSIKNLHVKKKHKFKKIKFKNFKINLDTKNFEKYKNIFAKKTNLVPISFVKGQIIFSDGKKYVATVNNANLYLKFKQDSIEAKLKGKFLNDDIYADLNSKEVDSKSSTDIILKMSNMNFLTKINFVNAEKDKNIKNGNLLVKKGKNKITAVFDYKDDELIINKSSLRNTFLDGKLKGKIVFLPYFNFNLDLNLNSINFTKLYNYLLALDAKEQKNLFKINNKINGKLSLSSDKIYSSYNLIKSIESRLKFNNGNILIEQFLFNLGKLGASDLLGAINNDKKFTNLRFESNIFIDSQKKFLSKFGIYNKKNLPSNFFVSGNFDLENLRASFYEISGEKKLENNDINFIEQEFNDFMLEDGLESLFIFPKFKEFIKSITSEIN
tara:strand:- start:263 stop:1981 length:1719 start_codon:yes stop_codon:yes gene_type:complete